MEKEKGEEEISEEEMSEEEQQKVMDAWAFNAYMRFQAQSNKEDADDLHTFLEKELKRNWEPEIDAILDPKTVWEFEFQSKENEE